MINRQLKAAMLREDFDRLIKPQQEIQKKHPFGSAEHRRAYEECRRLILEMWGHDIGEYE